MNHDPCAVKYYFTLNAINMKNTQRADRSVNITRANAKNKIWALEGYLLREQLSK